LQHASSASRANPNAGTLRHALQIRQDSVFLELP
jgi:hypothetical protein